MNKKHLSTVSAFALLGAVFVIGSASSAYADAAACPDAVQANEPVQLSAVTDEVVQTGSTYTYAYRVCNQSTFFGAGEGNTRFLIRDWEIPIFGEYNDGGIFIPETGGIDLDSITDPEGWTHAIEEVGVANSEWDGVAQWQDPTDTWNIFFDDLYGEDSNPFDDNQYVLHWYVDPAYLQEFGGCDGAEGESFPSFLEEPCIAEGLDLTGFGFEAGFDAVAAPFQTSWIEVPVNTGDPATPGAGGGGLPQTASLTPGTPPPTRVSAPGTLGLLVGGLGLFGAMRRRRKNK